MDPIVHLKVTWETVDIVTSSFCLGDWIERYLTESLICSGYRPTCFVIYSVEDDNTASSSHVPAI